MGLVAISVADGVANARGASTPTLDATHAQDAIETQRAKILQVGAADGAGSVLGVHEYQGDVYAFRNNAAQTECLMWKQSLTGWVQQDLGQRLWFDTGTAEFLEGETATQGGATANILRVSLHSGDWASNNASGYLIVDDVIGLFGVGLVTSASGSADCDPLGVKQNTMLPNGRFEFANYNFFGSAGTFRMYGVDGVNRAFEWDGSVFVPILTGNVDDNPSHIATHKFHLFLTFSKGSLQNSATGDPYYWGGLGANEIGCGDELVAIEVEIGGVLAIICRNRTYVLHGSLYTGTDADGELKVISEESGGIEWSAQRIGKTRYLDDRGYTDLTAADTFGDFISGVYSQLIEPLVFEKKSMVTASIIVKTKNQIRTFFNDGTAVITTFNNDKLAGFTTLRYLNSAGSSVVANCTANGENNLGTEIIFMGSLDGYVYQMDKGTSFDGGEVSASLILAYNNLRSPSYNKQFKKVVIEADGAAGVEISYNALYDYSSGVAPAGITLSKVLEAGGSLWNTAIWNNFNWASEDVSQIEGNLDGIGRNIGLQISSVGTYVEPHTLYGITYHYLNRKLVR